MTDQAFQKPTAADLRLIAERLGMSVTDDFLEAAIVALSGIGDSYRDLDALVLEAEPLSYPRSWARPLQRENLDNAWAVRTTLTGRPGGPLAGKRIALKDTISVADVPMRNGGSFPTDFRPTQDATVVTRILDAGGEIVGKAVCEAGSISGGSHTSATGPIPNPHNAANTSGGSSSGSAVLVARGAVDMAVGGDQGGSIRIPSSYCGIYGMKPTFGLVPYTGIAGLEPTIDHCGPMTATVADNALLLEVIAGPDGRDSRQAAIAPSHYTDALQQGVADMHIGILREGFGHANSDPAVDAIVRAAAMRFVGLGAHVEDVSIPDFVHGNAVWAALTYDGGFLSMWMSHGLGVGNLGYQDGGLAQAYGAWRDDPDGQPASIRMMMMFGAHSLNRHRGTYYAKAQNLRARLRASCDSALDRYDLLLMPTTPTTAPILPAPDADVPTYANAAWPTMSNLCPFNASGHPAMSVPCGMLNGLPVGMMLVARHFNEAAIYRAAHAYEQAGDA